MNRNHRFYLIASPLLCIFLSACQNVTPKAESSSAEQNDPDIVVMQGFGGNRTSRAPLGVKPMTLEELSSCATKIDSLTQESAQLKVVSAKLSSRNDVLGKQNRALESERSSVNTQNAKQVQDYNNRNEQNIAAIKQLNDDVNTHNIKTSSANVKVNDYNTSCVNRAYRLSDLAKLTPELRIAMESHSKTSEVPVLDESSPTGASSKGSIHIPSSSSHK